MKRYFRINFVRTLIILSSLFGPAAAGLSSAKALVIEGLSADANAIISLVDASLGVQTKAIADTYDQIGLYLNLFEQTQDTKYQNLADLETIKVQSQLAQYSQTVKIGESLLKELPSPLLGVTKFYTSPDLFPRLSTLANPLNTATLKFATSTTNGYALDLTLEVGDVSTPLLQVFVPAEAGSGPLTPVPLPPAVLLFGSAVLSFAAIGYGLKSRRAAAAA